MFFQVVVSIFIKFSLNLHYEKLRDWKQHKIDVYNNTMCLVRNYYEMLQDTVIPTRLLRNYYSFTTAVLQLFYGSTDYASRHVTTVTTVIPTKLL